MINGIISGEIKKAVVVSKTELEFKNYLEFPPVGKTGVLYIATDQNRAYRYVNGHYEPVLRDFGEIDTIQSII